ncbi:aldose 1-epimerase family protein [Ileibacterium valens]|uniref:aldose epimerase family protein n=1 Tax=Ileibacterium valens TaxID=1862668 RepID=UPI002574092D|nr:aldose 1-epimerase family protein [Ileibacterium valens]
MREDLTLENGRLKLTTRTRAGQMRSLIDKKNGFELIYQGDQGWKDQNPTLFPMVGSAWNDGKFVVDGKEYQMKNHGLIRYADLEGEVDGNKITYRMSSDEETRKQFPFDFEYEMSYELNDHSVTVSYQIKNPSDRDLPFSFGLHPAFRTSQNAKEQFEDFSIRFNETLKTDQLIFSADYQPVSYVPVEMDEWKLSRDDLNKYATLVFTHPNVTDAAIYYRDQKRMNVHFEGYPYLALWSHPTPSDMVCIEPWYGHADYEKKDIPFEKREGTLILKPGESFTCSYEISVPE